MTLTPRQAAEAHAAACRAALDAGEPRPAYTGPSLRGADLYGADLRGADLRGADLYGATIAEGTIAGHATGTAGGYRWHALALADGGCILQYGCDRATLAEWRTRSPEYGARHSHPPEHWATGPAVAIAAAEALVADLTTAEAASHAVARHHTRQETNR